MWKLFKKKKLRTKLVQIGIKFSHFQSPEVAKQKVYADVHAHLLSCFLQCHPLPRQRKQSYERWYLRCEPHVANRCDGSELWQLLRYDRSEARRIPRFPAKHPQPLGTSHLVWERRSRRQKASYEQVRLVFHQKLDCLRIVFRMREHVNDENKLPIIIFPEGTCINNTSVMMFKKGSFEIGSTIYPIAVKYDTRLTDAFWNSSAQSYGRYLWSMMTSWAIICDVWYLPPMTRKEDEDSITFAKRVKREIAKKGGLIDLEWDGALKRERVSILKVRKVTHRHFFRFLASWWHCSRSSTLRDLPAPLHLVRCSRRRAVTFWISCKKSRKTNGMNS